MLDPGDEMIVEDPTYLVALQSFHMYSPKILPVTMNSDGIDCYELEKTVKEHPQAKLIYLIPNFQNPTGLTYSKEVHDRAAQILKGTNLLVLEDNPYSELRFEGKSNESFGAVLGDQCCMLGTFSKIVTPGMRIGWICCRNAELKEKLLNYKATADLHTNIFCQMVLAQYLADNDIDKHIEKTKELYHQKAQYMMDCMKKYLPEGVEFTPHSGRHVPLGHPARRAHRRGALPGRPQEGRGHLPGDPFYEYKRNVRTFRINYSNSSNEAIEKGIRILGEVCRELMGN